MICFMFCSSGQLPKEGGDPKIHKALPTYSKIEMGALFRSITYFLGPYYNAVLKIWCSRISCRNCCSNKGPVQSPTLDTLAVGPVKKGHYTLVTISVTFWSSSVRYYLLWVKPYVTISQHLHSVIALFLKVNID